MSKDIKAKIKVDPDTGPKGTKTAEVGSSDCKKVTFDQDLAKRKEKTEFFHQLVNEYATLDADDLALHAAAVERAIDWEDDGHGVNPTRRLTGADRLAIARIAHGAASAYIRLTGGGHTQPWDKFDETTRMQLTSLVMSLHRRYNDPMTYDTSYREGLAKLCLPTVAEGIFLDTCRTLIRVWLKKSDYEYVL